jgi:uncharacterized protein YeeX (DUF496 family)
MLSKIYVNSDFFVLVSEVQNMAQEIKESLQDIDSSIRDVKEAIQDIDIPTPNDHLRDEYDYQDIDEILESNSTKYEKMYYLRKEHATFFWQNFKAIDKITNNPTLFNVPHLKPKERECVVCHEEKDSDAISFCQGCRLWFCKHQGTCRSINDPLFCKNCGLLAHDNNKNKKRKTDTDTMSMFWKK